MTTLMLLLALFVSTSHPLSLSLVLMLASVAYAIFMSKYLETPWLPYMLVMVFVSGLMVMVLYMTSLSSNETTNTPQTMFSVSLFLPLLFVVLMGEPSLTKNNFQKTESTSYDPMLKMVYKTYDQTHSSATLLIIVYLLFVLVVAVKMVSYNNSPLKTTK